MSFFVNNIELNDIYFNGNMVKEVYLNNTLVWNSFTWPGWDAATWEDIYDLCKAKQKGIITEWPSDVVVGAVKNTKLSATTLGFNTMDMLLIGIDVDGDGTLTFWCKNGMATKFAYGSYGSLSNTETNCNLVYERCDAKPYIKPVNKEWFDFETWTDKVVKQSPVWILSHNELYGDWTAGASSSIYQYIANGGYLTKTYPYWVRSWSTKTDDERTIYMRYIDTIGQSTKAASTTSAAGLAPVFVIG